MEGSVEKRIQWAVRFSEMEIEERDIPLLRKQVGDFPFGDAFSVWAGPSLERPFASELSHADLIGLQTEARAILKNLPPFTNPVHQVPIRVNMSVTCTNINRPPSVTLYGPVRDTFLFTLAILLTRVKASRIMRCADPKCGKVFFKIKGQKYCSPPCMNRAVLRNWRNGKKEEERSRQREKYVKKVRAKNGQKVKVGTNKRRK